MSPRKVDPQERSEQIITAAMALFAEKGFYQATMNDIVAASGLSKGGLYWHFDSKEALVLAILEQVFTQDVSMNAEILEAEGTVAERLTTIMVQSATEIMGMKPIMTIFNEFYALAPRSEAVRAIILRYFEQYQTLIGGLIEQGMAADEFQKMEPLTAAKLLIAQMEGLVLLWVLSNMESDLMAECKQATQIFVRGLMAEPRG
jgi:AcrR family transcriptional regulator